MFNKKFAVIMNRKCNCIFRRYISSYVSKARWRCVSIGLIFTYEIVQNLYSWMGSQKCITKRNNLIECEHIRALVKVLYRCVICLSVCIWFIKSELESPHFLGAYSFIYVPNSHFNTVFAYEHTYIFIILTRKKTV